MRGTKYGSTKKDGESPVYIIKTRLTSGKDAPIATFELVGRFNKEYKQK